MNSFTIRREKRAVFLLQGPWTSTACRKGNRMWPLREKPPPMSTPSASRCRLGWPRAAVQKAAHGKTSLTWVGFHLPLDFSLLKLFFALSFVWNLCNYWIFFWWGFDEWHWLAVFFWVMIELFKALNLANPCFGITTFSAVQRQSSFPFFFLK